VDHQDEWCRAFFFAFHAEDAQGPSAWPMAIPFPEVLRSRPRTDAKRLVSLQVVVMSWLALGSPTCAPEELRIGRKLTAVQWRVGRILMDLTVDGSTPQLVDAATMGRAASKFESSEEALAVLARAATALHVEQNACFGCSLLVSSVPFDVVSPQGLLQRPMW
jgi:hypothetical protein